MFVYLDETGDTGFKFNKGSSRFFVVTILLTPDPIPLNSAINDLRKQLHYSESTEFKFVHSSIDVRQRFLRVLVRHDVLIRSIVVDKHLLTVPHMRERETFYNYLVKMLLKYDDGRLRNAMLVLDQRGKGKKTRQGLAGYLRRELNRPFRKGTKINEIRYHESHRDNLIQAVDMASGAINAYYAKGDRQFLAIIRPKIDDIWHFPPY